jgi:methionyl-tRNA formyltransferase
MKQMSKPIVFFGNEKLATGITTGRPVLHALQEAGWDVKTVEIKDINNDELAAFGAEAAVLVAYGKILPADLLDLFPKGIINVHPSLLPLYRGSSPIESVILDGAGETGVSLMKLVAEMDAGPVYAQQKIELSGSESKQALADRLSEAGARLLAGNLPAILDGSRRPVPQSGQPTFSKMISKEDSLLDWSKPASRLVREVRAYAGWPRSRTTLGTAEVIITGAHAAEGQGAPGSIRIEGKELGVYTADGIFIIDSLLPAGKPEMPAEAFLAGYKI